MNTLKDIADWFFDENSTNKLSYAKVSLDTAINMSRIKEGDDGDFVIFDNAGGLAFCIWDGDALVEAIAGDERLASHVHAYRLRGKTKIFRTPVDVRGHWVEWQPYSRTAIPVTLAFSSVGQICITLPGWDDMAPAERSDWMWGVRWLCGLYEHRAVWFNEERQAIAQAALDNYLAKEEKNL